MSSREIEKQKSLFGILRLLFVFPKDIKRLWEVYITPIAKTWKKPAYADFNGDDAAYDLMYEATEIYRNTLVRVFRRAVHDKHCGRYAWGMVLSPCVSIWLSSLFVRNLFSSGAGWFLQLLILVAACAFFMLARNAWHNIAKCIEIADSAAIEAYNEILDVEPVQPPPEDKLDIEFI